MAGKWTGRLSGLFGKEPAQQKHEPLPEGADADSEGQKYLDSIRGKLAMLAEDFAGGRVNRAQFEELYTHYQRERENVARLIVSRPLSDAWRIAVSEGESVMIRRRLAARVLGYAVYAKKDQAALRVYGEFSSLASKWVSLRSTIPRIKVNLFRRFFSHFDPICHRQALCPWQQQLQESHYGKKFRTKTLTCPLFYSAHYS